MTLAALLFLGMLSPVLTPAVHPQLAMQSDGQQTPSAPSTPQPQSDQPTPDAQTPSTPAQTPSATAPVQAPSETAKPTTAKRRHKKKLASNCVPSAATGGDPSASGTATAAPVVNCPPPKKVVRNGGTAEPSIELVGGESGAKASGKRTSTDQLLGSTAQNLKKISGRELNSNQKEMLNQIHQYVDQAKAAVTAGDVERGHNLAVKAHLLSDELTKP